MSQAPLYLTRVGPHACFDRVVFDINGPEAVGLAARYVVRAPIFGTDSQGHQPGVSAPMVGQNLVSPSTIAGWSSLREVRFAGSFEGQTTVAVGVRDRLPFRVFVTSERSYQHVVVDISH